MNERPHVCTSWNAMNIPGCRRAIIARIRVSGSACRRKEIGRMYSVPFFLFTRLSRSRGFPKRSRFPLSSAAQQTWPAGKRILGDDNMKTRRRVSTV